MNPKESLGRWVSLIYRQGQIYLQSELEGLDIGSAQIPFLMILYDRDGLSQKEISNRLHVDKTTAGRDIRRLAKSGYVTREGDPKDKRAYKIFLTAKGKREERRIKEALARWTAILSSDLDDKEYELIILLMERMYQNALWSKESSFTSKRDSFDE